MRYRLSIRPTPSAPTPKPASVDDAELVGRIARHDQAAFEILMRRYNGKLFRVARAILRDDAERRTRSRTPTSMPIATSTNFAARRG